jgi:excisionase family DNA binding protein
MSSESAVPKQWLNVSEAADLIGVTKHTIYAYVSQRRVPFYKIPGSQMLKFRVSDLNAWLESGKVETIDEYLNVKEE